MRGGRAKSVVELVQEAVLRSVDEDEAYDDEIVRIALAGIADAEAGRYTTIATRQDGKNFIAQAMERARNIVAAET